MLGKIQNSQAFPFSSIQIPKYFGLTLMYALSFSSRDTPYSDFLFHPAICPRNAPFTDQLHSPLSQPFPLC